MSCASRAGCCWGWNRASKFQNELSTKLLVGISVNLKKNSTVMKQYNNLMKCPDFRDGKVHKHGIGAIKKLIEPKLEITLGNVLSHPISRKIWRYSDLTFMRGCKCPVSGGMPRASKLYDLNDLVFHEPL